MHSPLRGDQVRRVGPCIRHGAAISSFGPRVRTGSRWVGVVRDPCRCLPWWVGSFGRHAVAWHGGQRSRAVGRWPSAMGGSGGLVSSMWWGGGELSVGAADEPPAAVMDGPMMGPADQGQVVQVGGTTLQPMPDVMGFTPGQGPAK